MANLTPGSWGKVKFTDVGQEEIRILLLLGVGCNIMPWVVAWNTVVHWHRD